jgi:putative IMPACT (imprinted ancient) family translation regulator
VVVVVTRYFGGTKLGTGGLVRAYGDAVREVLSMLPRGVKVPTHTVRIEIPYSLLQHVRRAVRLQRAQVLNETFAAEVTMTARVPQDALPGLQNALQECSRGTIEARVIDSSDSTVLPIAKSRG